jgi:hypothetical protein
MIVVQADAALSASETFPGTPLLPEPSLLVLMLLAAIVAFTAAAGGTSVPIRRRRVNRARLRARRAGA